MEHKQAKNEQTNYFSHIAN